VVEAILFGVMMGGLPRIRMMRGGVIAT